MRQERAWVAMEANNSAMELRFDHLVIAARDLAEGMAWVEARLGEPMGPGGRHAVMGTHNRLLSLGPGRFLEVIAIDPEAPPPARARWFDLDAPAMRERLEAGPALVTWVVRTDDIGAALAASPARAEVLELERGAYRWHIGVPASGALARAGTSPTFIQWLTSHPSAALPDVGCRLERLVLRHAQAPGEAKALRAAGLDAADMVEARRDGEGVEAHIRTARGIVELRG